MLVVRGLSTRILWLHSLRLLLLVVLVGGLSPRACSLSLTIIERTRRILRGQYVGPGVEWHLVIFEAASEIALV